MAAYYEKEHAALNAPSKQKRRKGKDQDNKDQKKKAPKKGNQQTPSTLFNGMVNPAIPYGIKGAIWYQGESNAKHNNELYTKHFQAMITGWRQHWGQGDFPFYFVQLANFRKPVVDPVDLDPWAIICDQQRRTLSLKNTGMAVINDIGESNDVHPHNKIDVGKRLALWALKNDYDQDLTAWSGPLYQSHKVSGNTVILTFDQAGSGLMSGKKHALDPTMETKEPLKGFQICGKDRKWKWATATITGKNAIEVSHPDVAQPTIVRYAWAANPKGANLYNKEGLPASVFTTE